MTNAWRKVYGVTHGTTAKNWIDKKLSYKDLLPYSWPTEKEKNKTIKVITTWLNDRANPILKCIVEYKKISSEKDAQRKKLLKYVEKFDNTMSQLEEDGTDQVELIGDAMKDLDKVLKKEEMR